VSNTAAAEIAIHTLIATAWNYPADPKTPVQWPNVNFDPPDPGKGPAEWIKIDIAWGDGEAITMGAAGQGSRRNTLAGVLFISGFTPKNTAYGPLLAHMDAMRDVLNRVAVSGVRFGVPSAPKQVDDERWAMLQITCGFTVDELI
jgi:hypothetical protein